MLSQFLNEFISIEIVLISFGFILILAISNLIPLVLHSAGRILTITHKIVTTIAAGTVIANSFPPSKNSDSDKEKKKDSDKNNSKNSDNKSVQPESNNTDSNNNSGTSKSFVLPFIFSFLNIEITDSSSRIIELANGVFMLSLVSFICLLNVFFYSLVYLLIQQSSYETRYPRLI